MHLCIVVSMIWTSMYLCFYEMLYCVSACLSLCVPAYLCIRVSLYQCIRVSMYLCIHSSMYLRIYLYLRMYACMHVTMSIHHWQAAYTHMPGFTRASCIRQTKYRDCITFALQILSASVAPNIPISTERNLPLYVKGALAARIGRKDSAQTKPKKRCKQTYGFVCTWFVCKWYRGCVQYWELQAGNRLRHCKGRSASPTTTQLTGLCPGFAKKGHEPFEGTQNGRSVQEVEKTCTPFRVVDLLEVIPKKRPGNKRHRPPRATLVGNNTPACLGTWPAGGFFRKPGNAAGNYLSWTLFLTSPSQLIRTTGTP